MSAPLLPPVRLAISPHFCEKENRAPKRDGNNQYAFGEGFENVTLTTRDIANHLLAGKALCSAALDKGRRRKDAFLSAQVMGLDFDDGVDVSTALNHHAIGLGGAFYIYPTASSSAEKPKTRMLFRLDRAINDAAEYERLIKRLIHAYAELRPDAATKDCVRLWYGSKQRGMWWDTELPLADLLELAPHPDELRTQPVEARPALELRRDYSAYVAVALERVLAGVSAARAGERNDTLNKAAFRLGQFVSSDWANLTRMDAERELLRAAPIGGDFPQHEAEKAIRSGLDAGMQHPQPAPKGYEVQRPAASALSVIEQAAKLAIPTSELVVSSVALAEGYPAALARIDRTPLIFPFHVLHHLGGFAQAVVPGKLIGLVGISGGMKTSAAETITDSWRQEHGVEPVDVLWWGPEWTAEEMFNRAVQRYGTVDKPTANYQDVVLHQRWLAEDAVKVPTERRIGRRMLASMYENSVKAAAWIGNWPGRAYYVTKMDLPLDVLLASMAGAIDELAAAGRRVRVVVFDYVQLLQLRDVRSELERIEQALGLIKAFCADRGLIGIVNSQVTKAQSSGVREGSDTLEVEAGQFLRSDKFNLIITLNPRFDGGLLTSAGVLNVAKNSAGRTGKVTVRIDPARLRWLDEVSE